MNIKIMSREGAVAHKPEGNSFIIRIADNEVDHNDLNENYTKELRLGFYDAISVQGLPSNWNIFSSEDAEKVLHVLGEAVETNADELIIHCHQGISRSSAIAVAYGYIYNDRALIEMIDKGPYVPNIRVITVLLNKAGIWRENRNEVRAKYGRD